MDEQHEQQPVTQTVNMPQLPMPQSMGLTGVFATVANFSEVVIVTGLLVWFLTVSVPMGHERAAMQRQMDRDKHSEELRELGKREDERLKNLWIRQTEIKTALTELMFEVRAMRKQ